MMSTQEDAARTAGRLWAGVLEAIHLRLELIALEVGEERERLGDLLLSAVVVVFALFMLLLSVNLALLASSGTRTASASPSRRARSMSRWPSWQRSTIARDAAGERDRSPPWPPCSPTTSARCGTSCDPRRVRARPPADEDRSPAQRARPRAPPGARRLRPDAHRVLGARRRPRGREHRGAVAARPARALGRVWAEAR